eukprot:361074-Chlamydomonas_euryale.AAC.9
MARSANAGYCTACLANIGFAMLPRGLLYGALGQRGLLYGTLGQRGLLYASIVRGRPAGVEKRPTGTSQLAHLKINPNHMKPWTCAHTCSHLFARVNTCAVKLHRGSRLLA